MVKVGFSTTRKGRTLPAIAGILLGCILGLAGYAREARAEAPSAYMQRVANELMAAARTGSSSSMAAVIRAHADVTSIGLTALGSYKERLAQTDRPAYYNGVINFIARYGAKEAPKYPVSRAVMVAQSAANSATSYVDSRVTLRSGYPTTSAGSSFGVGRSTKSAMPRSSASA